MKSGKPIFIHSLFRTGSTYTWHQFRQNDRYRCYYEPLHQIFPLVTKNNIHGAFVRDPELVNHPPMSTPYLLEYAELLDAETPGLPFYKKSFGFDEFCRVDENPDFKKYIDSLIRSAGDKIPVLQFNRSALRITWFKNQYPGALNIYLVRNPADQWESYAGLKEKTGDLIFFTMDLLTAGVNRGSPHFKALAEYLPLFEYHHQTFEREKEFYHLILDAYSPGEKYFIFYYTWFRAFIENVLIADFIININRLSEDKSYRREVTDFLHSRGAGGVDFENARVKTYDSYSLEPGIMRDIEDTARQLVLRDMTIKRVDSFFRRLSPEDSNYFGFDPGEFLEKRKTGKVSPPSDSINDSINIRDRVIETFEKIISLIAGKYFEQVDVSRESDRALHLEKQRGRRQEEDYTRQLEKLSSRLGDKERRLENIDSDLARLGAAIEEKETLIHRQISQINRGIEELKNKESQLDEKEKQVAAQNIRIKALERELGQKDVLLEKQAARNEEKNSLLEKKTTLIKRKDALLKNAAANLERKNKKLEEQAALLERKNSRLAEQTGLLKQKNAHIAHLRAHIEQRDISIRQLKKEFKKKDAQLNAQLRAKNAEIRKIYRSYTYRIGYTAAFPLKLVKRALKKTRKAVKSIVKPGSPGKNNKEKLAFIDHSFHQKSRATAFLVDLLEKEYHVTVFWDRSWQRKPRVDLNKIVETGFRTVVFFQIVHYPKRVFDVLRGLNVIVVPMYDACHDLSDSYWQKFAGFKFLNFSRTLHEKFESLGYVSQYVQYFPPAGAYPAPALRSARSAGPAGFLWQRTEEIAWDRVKRVIQGTPFERFHIHNAPDPAGSNAKEGREVYRPAVPSDEEKERYNITVSRWFPQRKDYFGRLRDFNIYFAPRKYEGIGMSFLEAMGMGKCVVAPANPTMSEYIRHGETGLLYDPDNPEPLDFSQAAEIGANAAQYVKDGYKKWEASAKTLLSFIKTPFGELAAGSRSDVVYHFNTHVAGGSGIAAVKIFNSLVDAGIKGRLYSLDDFDKPGYVQFRPGLHMRKTSKESSNGKLREYLENRPGGFEAFSLVTLPHVSPVSSFGRLPAVVHLHWLGGFIDFPSFFGSIPDDLPVVWTVHDMNPFTGGCHYSWECKKYKENCDSCPQLIGYPETGLSRTNFKLKWEALKGKNLHIAANSRWTEARVRESRLLSGAKSIQTIYIALDADVFRPLDREQCRGKLGLDVKPGTVVLCFGTDYLTNKRKGFAKLLEALKILEDKDVDIACLIFGHDYQMDIDVKFEKKYVGFVRDPGVLAEVYSASDLFVMPSLYEAFGQTVIEAMACGIPVVGFDTGGIPEIVEDNVSGLLAPVGDVHRLAEKIETMILDPGKRLEMGKKARQTVENTFTLRHQQEQYLRLYRGLLEKK